MHTQTERATYVICEGCLVSFNMRKINMCHMNCTQELQGHQTDVHRYGLRQLDSPHRCLLQDVLLNVVRNNPGTTTTTTPEKKTECFLFEMIRRSSGHTDYHDGIKAYDIVQIQDTKNSSTKNLGSLRAPPQKFFMFGFSSVF